MNAQDLKNSILQLAMQGKLVPQDPNDEPASVLLKKIKQEKEQLIKEKIIRKNKNESLIFRKNGHFFEKIGKNGEEICIDDEITFDVPNNWELCRLSSLGISTSGKTPKSKELHSQGKYPYFKVGDMNTPGNELYLHVTENYLLEDYSSKLFAPNSIVYPKNGGAVFTNKRRILKQESVVDLNTGVFSPYSCLDLMFIFMIFQSIDFKKYHKGTALPTIDKKRMDNILIGLPPLNEQKRIVSKIEEILPLIDEYGANEEQLNQLNSEFPSKLKSSILQEAVQGKLVPQDPNDEPASVLLENIKLEKAKLIKAKKIKKNNKESYIFKRNGHFYERIGSKGEEVCIDEEVVFDVPDNWELCRLSSLGISTSGKTPKAKELHSQGKYPYFKVGDMNTPGNELYLHITENYLEENYSSKLFAPNSIVYPKNGGAVFTNKKRILKQESVVDLNTGVFSPYSCLDLMFIFMIFQSIDFKKYYKGTALPTIDKKRMDNILIGLPPLNEQKRIVDKIEQLFNNVDVLIEE